MTLNIFEIPCKTFPSAIITFQGPFSNVFVTHFPLIAIWPDRFSTVVFCQILFLFCAHKTVWKDPAGRFWKQSRGGGFNTKQEKRKKRTIKNPFITIHFLFFSQKSPSSLQNAKGVRKYGIQLPQYIFSIHFSFSFRLSGSQYGVDVVRFTYYGMNSLQLLLPLQNTASSSFVGYRSLLIDYWALVAECVLLHCSIENDQQFKI